MASSNKCASDTTGNGSAVGLQGPHGAQDQEGGGASGCHRGSGTSEEGIPGWGSVAKGTLEPHHADGLKQGSWFLVPGECCKKGLARGQKTWPDRISNLAQN